MGKHLAMGAHGGVRGSQVAIFESTLAAVTDGSYIQELYPNLCSAAFVIECSKGCSRVVGAFLATLLAANAYRGELLGLMSIHLILLSVNKIKPTLDMTRRRMESVHKGGRF